jgi:hypothetical protein
MCIIAICAEGRKLTDTEFTECWNGNTHGMGIGWYHEEKTHFEKGFMKLKDATDFYKSFPENINHVVHFRISTSGGTVPELTHPFVLGRNKHEPKNTYVGTTPLLFHNGIVTNYEEYVIMLALTGTHIPEVYNDSMVMAMLFGKLWKNGIPLEKLIMKYSGKYALVFPDKIVYSGDTDFHNEKGVLFSNFGYRTTRLFNDKSYRYDDYDEWDAGYNRKHKNSKHNDLKSCVWSCARKKYVPLSEATAADWTQRPEWFDSAGRFWKWDKWYKMYEHWNNITGKWEHLDVPLLGAKY